MENDLLDVATLTPETPKKHRCWPKVLLVLILMGVSFLVGWRLMAYRWWPVIAPTVKKAVYAVIPSLEPEPIVYEPIASYNPASDAKVGDVVSKTDSVFYYIYRPTCGACAGYGDMILGGLPETITLADGTVSKVVMIALNKSDELENALIQEYYEQHAVPEDQTLAPSVIIGDTYLMGSLALRDGFWKALLNGEGLTTPLIDGAMRLE